MTTRNQMARIAGEALDRALGEAPGRTFLKHQADLLVTRMQAAPRGYRWGRIALAGTLAASVLIGITAIVLWLVAPVSFTVGDTAWTADNVLWVENVSPSSLPIRFEGGSRIDLIQGSAARVTASNRRRVMVQLKEGRLEADIDGNGFTEWVVAAGPFRVKVLGTRFMVNWDGKNEVFEVEVTRGRVMVNEAGRATSAILLETGKRLHAEGRSGQIRIEPSRSLIASNGGPEPKTPGRDNALFLEGSGPRVAPSTLGVRPGDQEDRLPAVVHPSATIPPDRPAKRGGEGAATRGERAISLERGDQNRPARFGTAAPTWRQKVKEKDWAGALQDAQDHELTQMAHEADLDALWYLATTLRHQRKAKEATRLFKAMRERFPDASRSETALFLLGKISYSLLGDNAGARDWFTRYLREVPNGTLREEALGHLMEVCLILGDRPCAKGFAAEYLSRYKGGVFHDRATSIVSD